MPILSLVKKLSKNYANDVSKNKSSLDQQVNSLFNKHYDFNEEDHAHLYASLASNERVCVPVTKECQTIKETGHNRVKGLSLYFRLLLEVAVKSYAGSSPISETAREAINQELERTYQTIKLLQHRQTNSLEEHLKYLMQEIRKLVVGDTLRYHAGFIGHTVYLNVHRNKNGWLVVINNLGAGFKENHCFIETSKDTYLVYARSVWVTKWSALADYLNAVAGAAGKDDETAAMQALYPPYSTEQQNYDKRFLICEISQSTGNCVIKNKLCAAREALKDETAYLELYQSLLDIALNYRAYFVEHQELPSKSDVCRSLNSQLSFLMQNTTRSCEAVLDGIQICKTETHETADITRLIVYIIGGALLGGVIGNLLYREDKSEKEATGIGALIGAFGGGIFAKFSATTVEKEVCRPLEETSKHCYSCPVG